MAGGGGSGARGGALDRVLDLAQDVPAGGGAVLGRVPGGRGGVGEAAREDDAAADGAGGAVEGGRDADEGVWAWGVWRKGRSGLRYGVPRRGRGGGPMGGLGGGLVVQEAGEAGAHVDQLVQDMAVVVRVCRVRAGGVRAGFGVEEGRGWLGGHERNKNIVGLQVSRLVWEAVSRVGMPVPGGGRSPCRATIRATLSAASSDTIEVALRWAGAATVKPVVPQAVA